MNNIKIFACNSAEEFTKEIKVSIKNPINQEIQCAIEEKENVDDNTKWITPKNNICEFSVKAGSYYIFLKNNKISNE